MTNAHPKAELQDFSYDFEDAIRDNLTPDAVGVIAHHLKSFSTGDSIIDCEIRWVAANLANIVGGLEQAEKIHNEIIEDVTQIVDIVKKS
jgi:hypothetical protein